MFTKHIFPELKSSPTSKTPSPNVSHAFSLALQRRIEGLTGKRCCNYFSHFSNGDLEAQRKTYRLPMPKN